MVRESSGQLLYASTRALKDIQRGDYSDAADLFPISPHLLPGSYLVTLTLESQGGLPLASAQASFSVAYSASQSIVGSVSAESPFGTARPLPVTVALENPTAVGLAGGRLEVVLLDATLLRAESSAVQLVDLGAKEAQSFTLSVPTLGVTEGLKLLVAQVDGRTVGRALAQAEAQLDIEPPLIFVGGVEDLLLTREDVTPTVTVTDESSVEVTVTLDGQPFASGTAVTAEGEHALHVLAVDASGNSSEVTIRFTIDKTPPALFLSGVAHGAVVNAPVALAFSATDEHLSWVSSTADGLPISSGQLVSSEGEHLWVVSAMDGAGNSATESRSFVLDYTPPAISVSGVADGQFSNSPLTPQIEVTDAHPGPTTITLDGQPFASGTEVSQEGAHTLAVIATDAAKNQSSLSLRFTLDTTAPVPWVVGAADGQYLGSPPTVTFGADDENLDTVLGMLDGAPFASGGTVAQEGPHLLAVTAIDRAQNRTEASVGFTVDLTPPTLSVSGVADGAYLAAPVTISFSATDANLATVSALLDGSPFTSGGTAAAEGPHHLALAAADLAGHRTAAELDFVLDFTPPTISILGVSEGEVAESFTIHWTATDDNLAAASATLDGAPFPSGGLVGAAGSHLLVVTASDRAGNTARRTVNFRVPPTRPSFHFAACAFERLTLSNNTEVASSGPGIASVACNGDVTVENSALVSGDVVAGGSLILRNAATVGGTAYYGGALAKQGQAGAAGGEVSLSPAPSPCECGFDTASRLTFIRQHNDNALLAAEPSIAPHLQGGGLKVHNASVLLPAGRFYFDFVELTGKALVATRPGASAELYVGGKVTVSNTSTLGAPPASAEEMLLVSGASPDAGQPVTVRNHTSANLLLYAPAADVVLENNSTLYGAVVGKTVALRNLQKLRLAPPGQETPPPLTCP